MAVVRKKQVRKLDLQTGLNKVLLSLKHHKMQPNRWIATTASNLPIYMAQYIASICLLRVTTAVSRPSEYLCISDMPQKAVPAKVGLFTFGSGSVMVSYIAY